VRYGKQINAAVTLVLAAAALAWVAQREWQHEHEPGRRAGLVAVMVGGRTLQLEVADDELGRERGLGGRAAIAEDGGMMFVFPRPEWQVFVMRDCPISIDVIFLVRSTAWP